MAFAVRPVVSRSGLSAPRPRDTRLAKNAKSPASTGLAGDLDALCHTPYFMNGISMFRARAV